VFRSKLGIKGKVQSPPNQAQTRPERSVARTCLAPRQCYSPRMSLFQRPSKNGPSTPPTTPPEESQTKWGDLKLELVWLSDAEQMNVHFQDHFKHPYPTTSAELAVLQDQAVIRDIEEARFFVQERMSYMDRIKDASDPRSEVLKLEKELAQRQRKECDLPGHSL
jgi:hypothetical protein